jgi:flagellar protein FliO/FliZ
MEYQDYVRGLAALVAVLALITIAAWGARRLGLAGNRIGPRRERRLAIAEVLAVDNRRRLLLVKRDDIEHLLLIGGADDVLLESGIDPSAPRRGLPKFLEELKP